MTLDAATLPMTGWTARLHGDNGHPARLVLDPGGGSPITHSLLPQTASGQLVLGAHLTRPRSGPASGMVTLAYGVAPKAPLTVTFVRYRSWRPAGRRQTRPLILGDRVWLAECGGVFDEVQVTAGGHTTTRLL
ncbi:hypothetical protein [Thermomonospora amylolytica]|uniref:hypothetical protein n=1 Tax=Thermomonospora amylolytica TaxID=1411117 RepID=UPI000E6D15AD|nr:hypothetical protein [Thermomonospora amylolytica]